MLALIPTYLPLLDEELAAYQIDVTLCIILKLRIYRMVDDLFVLSKSKLGSYTKLQQF